MGGNSIPVTKANHRKSWPVCVAAKGADSTGDFFLEIGLPIIFNHSLRFKTRYATQKGVPRDRDFLGGKLNKIRIIPRRTRKQREPDTGLRDESGAKTVQYDGQPVLFD